MGEHPAQVSVPEWDLADRMRKALRESGLSVQDMAGYLEVTMGTVSTWIIGSNTPTTQTIRLWALRCGVPFEWLCHGSAAPCDRRAGSPPKGSNYMQSNLTGIPALKVVA